MVPEHVHDHPVDHRRADCAALLQLTRGRIEEDLGAICAQYPDPICEAAIRLRARSLLEQLSVFEAFWHEFQKGALRLADLEHIRETTFEMFCRLVGKCNASQSPPQTTPSAATTYRSLSVCTTSDYFGRPLISVLTRQFDQAVIARLGRPIEGTTPRVRVERIVIVPNRYWPFGRDRDSRLKRWWMPVYRALEAQVRKYKVPSSASHVVMDLRFLNFEGVLRRQLEPSVLDFGIYGDIMIGVYSRSGASEELTLFHRDSLEMQRCASAWRELEDASQDLKTWDQLADALDLNGECLDD